MSFTNTRCISLRDLFCHDEGVRVVPGCRQGTIGLSYRYSTHCVERTIIGPVTCVADMRLNDCANCSA